MAKWSKEEIEILRTRFDGSWASCVTCTEEINKLHPYLLRTVPAVYRKIRQQLEYGCISTRPVHSVLTRKKYRYAHERQT